MSNALIALFLAAGLAGVAYTKLGKRAGYGNAKNVWTLVGVTFVVVYLMVLVLLNTLISLD